MRSLPAYNGQTFDGQAFDIPLPLQKTPAAESPKEAILSAGNTPPHGQHSEAIAFPMLTLQILFQHGRIISPTLAIPGTLGGHSKTRWNLLVWLLPV